MKKTILIVLVSIALAISSFAVKKELLSIHSMPKSNYDYFITSLRKLIYKEKLEKDNNHFFIAKYAKKNKVTYLYWREGRMVIIINKGDSQIAWDMAIVVPRGSNQIMLDKDVVEKESDIRGSSYLVIKAWISEIIYKCVVDGDMIVIEKNPVRPNKELGK